MLDIRSAEVYAFCFKETIFVRPAKEWKVIMWDINLGLLL